MFKIIESLPLPNDNRSKIGFFVVILIYFGVYIKDIASPVVGVAIPTALIGLAIIVGFNVVLLRIASAAKINKISQNVVLASMTAWLLSTIDAGSLNLSSYYLAIPCAFVIINTKPRFFLKLMVIHFLISLAMQSIEYATGHYFFIYNAADGSVLNEELFGGGLDIFRAKGMFQGPLSAVAFSLWLAFMFRGSVFFVIGLFLSAFFASGRLGMVVATILLIVRVFLQKQDDKRSKSLLGLAIVASIAFLLFKSIDENRMIFISSAFDLRNDQNVSRLEFWGTSLQHFLNYPLEKIMFGNFGYIQAKEGGTENDFLRIALDNGVVGFMIYMIPFAILFLSKLKKRKLGSESGLIWILIFLLMNIFPFVQSLSSSLLFWIFAFTYLNYNSIRKSELNYVPLPYLKD
ncbi:O-antigen ligase family protein [Glaciimonas sp. GNP009]